MTKSSITGNAHAKVNLGLEILSKRSDGFHEISTVFCPIGLSDEIRFDLDDTLSLNVNGIHVPTDETNLCIRAARHLLASVQHDKGVRMTMQKRIPVGAGLGGGSSDAACVLTSLNTLWDLHLPAEELASIGMKLGADVPYFLRGGLCHARGIGEDLAAIDASFPYWIVTVMPPEHISTAWAYGQIRPRNTTHTTLKEDLLHSLPDLDTLETILQNDFEEVVLPAYDEVRTTKADLAEAGLRCVRMSGTGSAVFGLSASEEIARKAANVFKDPFVVSLTPPLLP